MRIFKEQKPQFKEGKEVEEIKEKDSINTIFPKIKEIRKLFFC